MRFTRNSAYLNAEELYQRTKHHCAHKGFYQLFIKRCFDIIICLLFLPIFLLISLPIAVAIKSEDGGPVFYKSWRLGKNFREFPMFKFRSMRVNAPDIRNSDGSTYNSKTDPRVTRVGRFIRETSLDELPQCFNVILGHMSLVGPRAGDVESKNTYESDEKDKLLVRPGITGYTQAYYRNSLPVREKRLYDACYAHNVSLWLDIKILFKTVSAVLQRDNIYTNEAEDTESQHSTKST